MISESPSEKFYKSPSILIGLALHAVLFLWLFQLALAPEVKNRIDTTIGEHTVESLLKETGIFGFITYYYDTHTEARLFYRYAKLTLKGELDTWLKKKNRHLKVQRPWPYRDINIEYQPGALLTLLPPALLSDNFDEYRFWLGAWLGGIYIFNLAAGLYLFVGGRPAPEQLKRMLWWSVVFLLLFGGITVTRFDHVVVTCILCSALAFKAALKRVGNNALVWYGIFGIISALGVMTKIVPGLVIPAALLILLLADKPRWKESGTVIGSLTTALILINIVFYMIFGNGYLKSFTFHMERGVQLESVYSGFILLAHKAGLPATVGFSYGGMNVDSAFTPAVKLLSPILFLCISGLIAWRFWKYRHASMETDLQPEEKVRQLLIITIVFVLAFILTNKIFSPQFILWIGPLIAAWVGAEKNMLKISALFLSATLLTQVIYPRLYHFLINLYYQMVIVLNVRNILLALLLALLLIELPRLLKKGETPA